MYREFIQKTKYGGKLFLNSSLTDYFTLALLHSKRVDISHLHPVLFNTDLNSAKCRPAITIILVID